MANSSPYQHMKRLRPRHYTILRLLFEGEKQGKIAEMVGMSQGALSCLVNSPLAKAELARMQEEATNGTLQAMDRGEVVRQLQQFAIEGITVARSIMLNPVNPAAVRLNAAKHAMDRVIFDKEEEDSGKGRSYRDILRGIKAVEDGQKKLEQQLSTTTIIVEGERVDG